jgi:hypothetical protein
MARNQIAAMGRAMCQESIGCATTSWRRNAATAPEMEFLHVQLASACIAVRGHQAKPRVAQRTRLHAVHITILMERACVARLINNAVVISEEILAKANAAQPSRSAAATIKRVGYPTALMLDPVHSAALLAALAAKAKGVPHAAGQERSASLTWSTKSTRTPPSASRHYPTSWKLWFSLLRLASSCCQLVSPDEQLC